MLLTLLALEQFDIPQYNLSQDHYVMIEDAGKQYLGQPDMILMHDNNTLLTVYPEGHGLGRVILRNSTDKGKTWSERLPTPDSWKNSMETPTIYNLNFVNGSRKIIYISGGPGWGSGFLGWTTSISNDDAKTFSEYKVWYNGTDVIVGMSSLNQLKENGKYVDKWVGTFHDHAFHNYKTFLTFDAQGNEQWSKPEYLLAQWRDIEYDLNMCELLIFRDPHSDYFCLIARVNSHRHYSAIAFSDDEYNTWSKPYLTPGALTGDRHKLSIDPISGRLVISFREIKLNTDANGKITGGSPNDFVAWVGTYDYLVLGGQGDYRIRLLKDYGELGQRAHGDNGYAGNVALPDGTIVIDTYGVFDPNTPKGDGNKVMSVHFKLGEVENENNLVDRAAAYSAIEKLRSKPEVVQKLQTLVLRKDVQQIELERAVESALTEL